MDLLLEKIEVFAMLKNAMYPMCTIQNMELRDMVKDHEVDHGSPLYKL